MNYLLTNSTQDIFYYPTKSGLLNSTPDKSYGRQFKLPNPCRIPELLLSLLSHYIFQCLSVPSVVCLLHYIIRVNPCNPWLNAL